MNLDNCISKHVFDRIFKDHGIKIAVFPRTKKSKGDNFDKFRNIGFDKTKQNPLFIDALKKDVAPNSLIIREMGLNETGALQIIIKTNNVSFIRLSEKIEINNIAYYIFNDAVGNRLQIFDLSFGYSKIIIFRKKK